MAIVPASTAKVVNKPQDKSQDNRDKNAACYRKINPPVLRAKLQIAWQLEQPNPPQHDHQNSQHDNNKPCRDQPFSELLRPIFHIISNAVFTPYRDYKSLSRLFKVLKYVA